MANGLGIAPILENFPNEVMPVSFVCIRLEIADDACLIDFNFKGTKIKAMSKRNGEKSKQQPPKKEIQNYDKEKLRGKREIQKLTVETHNAAQSSAVCSKPSDEIPFFSGNPFVEKTEGLIHIFKHNDPCNESENRKTEMLCMLAVPAFMTTHDLLQFLAPAGEAISQIRVIRDSSPNQYMVLITFREQSSADEFYKNYHGKAYNSIESELCHLVYVDRVETLKESEGAGLPLEGYTELPTCPVCLERMDESVDGILTILCNHAFHANCLNQWGYSSCPVCRYVQTPELTPEHKCFVCNKQQDLWICLICGHIGCGRYAEAHAVLHFQETQHTFSLEVGGQRVWDYAGDNYVHRLIQSKSDGKVVEFNNGRGADGELNDEKLDGITLEYTYLLTNQLESQRLYFEEKLAIMEKINSAEMENLERRLQKTVEDCARLEKDLSKCVSEKNSLEKKLQQITTKLNKCQQELKDEQTTNAILRQDQQVWAEKTKYLEKSSQEFKVTKEKEIADLQEQLRDLMFHFEAQAKLKETEGENPSQDSEIREGRLVVGDAPVAASKKNLRKKQK